MAPLPPTPSIRCPVCGMVSYHPLDVQYGYCSHCHDYTRLPVLPFPTYSDLHITTAKIERTSIFNLPYGLDVRCNRVSGWEVWDMNQFQPGGMLTAHSRGVLIAGEYAGPEEGLRLDVAGHIICDSLTPQHKG